MANVTYVNQADFQTVVLDSDVPVLVDFYADWCMPCKAMGPTLAAVAETSEARFVKINIDDNPDVTAHYGVTSIPALVLFRGGQVVAHHRGLANKDQISKMLAGPG